MNSIEELRSKAFDLKNLPEQRLELVEVLNKLVAAEHRNFPGEALQHAEEALALSSETGDDNAIASSLHACGAANWVNGNLDKALECYNSSLEIRLQLANPRGIAESYNNIGIIHSERGNYGDALDCYLRSLHIKIDLEDKRGCAISYLNIGNIYKHQSLLDEAQNSYNKALSIYEELNEETHIASCHNNMGLVEQNRGNIELAMDEHKKALAIRLELNDIRGISNSYGNIGAILSEQNQFAEARKNFLNSLELKEKIHDNRGISNCCSDIGTTYLKENKFDEALKYINRGLTTARNIGARSLEATSLSSLSEFYEAQGDYKQALKYMKKCDEIKEELFNTENTNRIAVLSVKYGTERKQKEVDSVKQINSRLETLVQARTAELMEVNLGLETEISERKFAEQALIDAENSLKASYDKLEKSFEGIIHTISKIVELRDPYYHGHHLRTAELARSIASEMLLDDEQIQAIYFASIVYGVGKIKIPQELLSRSGKLSELELKVIRTYPQSGYEILKAIEFPWPIADIVLQHHEFMNGSGYPFGLTGSEIMQEARILCVANIVEAMSSRRPYRPPHDIKNTVEELHSNRGILYDNHSVDACISVINRGLFKPREDYIHT